MTLRGFRINMYYGHITRPSDIPTMRWNAMCRYFSNNYREISEEYSVYQ